MIKLLVITSNFAMFEIQRLNLFFWSYKSKTHMYQNGLLEPTDYYELQRLEIPSNFEKRT